MGCRPESLHPVLYPGFVLFVGSRAKGVESACRATEGPGAAIDEHAQQVVSEMEISYQRARSCINFIMR